ncbi:hypothetical protein [Nonlabens ulvanivorans]|uniref:hypothetical protein n=1 Tax=Nonlabens ulvanivorans TaxID=906888 RepID=UPI0037C7A7BB
MKKLVIITITIITSICFTSCYYMVDLVEDCGAIKTFTVDKEFANKWDFPDLEFSMDYHEDMETQFPSEGGRNINYASFIIKDQDSIWTESFGIGKYKSNGYAADKRDELNMSLLNQFSNMYKGVFEINDEFKGKRKIDGKDYMVYEAKGSIDRADVGFKGDYLLKMMIVEPQKNADNGLIYIMQANQDSPIKSFEDFGKLGCTATIYQSLKFN